jgi:5-methylcytosine-specific restriction endonuclease McrA
VSGFERVGDVMHSGCTHESVAVRAQQDSAGRALLARQCLDCGARTSEWLSKSEAPEAPPWDYTLPASKLKSFVTRTQQEINAKHEAAEREWRRFYEDYLRSPAWRERRDHVMKRAGGMCEGCAIAPATEVHHRTYVRLAREMLFDLAALCDDCHHEIHFGQPPPELARIEARRKPL